jgi:choline kinase
VRAVILAAGVGNRLDGRWPHPKSLLAFGGASLLERHLRILAANGIDHVSICVGYLADEIRAAVQNTALQVECIENPDFRRGSLVSLWVARHALAYGGNVLLMDADVLYGRSLMERLVRSEQANCLLLDRDYAPGDEPVKACVRNHQLVEFRKRPDPSIRHDFCGESVGFFKFDGGGSRALIEHCARYIDAVSLDEPYEEPIRDLIRAQPGCLGFEDITGLPWLEIDFPEDISRARQEILPRLERDDA